MNRSNGGGAGPPDDPKSAQQDSEAPPSSSKGGVQWQSGAPSEPWHSDSSLPAAEQISEISEAAPAVPEEIIAEPEPVDDVDDDDFSEALTEIPGRRAGVPKESRQRSQTIARKQMLRERRRLIAQGGLPVVLEYERPKHRSDCRDGKRPCLYVACRYHLFLDVNPTTGSIKINFPGAEVWQLEETCALDVAERGGITLEEVGDIMNLTRERIRQVEASGLDKLRTGEASLSSFLGGDDIVVGGPATNGHHLLPVLDD